MEKVGLLFMKSVKIKARNHKTYDLIAIYVYGYMFSVDCHI